VRDERTANARTLVRLEDIDCAYLCNKASIPEPLVALVATGREADDLAHDFRNENGCLP
jgi:hypothetical protein